MINQIVLVGKIEEIDSSSSNKKKIKLGVERPFDESKGRVFDVFVCQLWNSIFSKITSVCNIGDMLAIRGRIEEDNNEYIVIAENVVLLNKSK